MNNTNRALLMAASTAVAFWVTTLTATAEKPKTNNQPPLAPSQTCVGRSLADCTAYLDPSWVGTVKPDFVSGNVLVGTFDGFEAEFAIFTLKESKKTVYIPKIAILYMTGKRPTYNF